MERDYEKFIRYIWDKTINKHNKDMYVNMRDISSMLEIKKAEFMSLYNLEKIYDVSFMKDFILLTSTKDGFIHFMVIDPAKVDENGGMQSLAFKSEYTIYDVQTSKNGDTIVLYTNVEGSPLDYEKKPINLKIAYVITNTNTPFGPVVIDAHQIKEYRLDYADAVIKKSSNEDIIYLKGYKDGKMKNVRIHLKMLGDMIMDEFYFIEDLMNKERISDPHNYLDGINIDDLLVLGPCTNNTVILGLPETIQDTEIVAKSFIGRVVEGESFLLEIIQLVNNKEDENILDVNDETITYFGKENVLYIKSLITGDVTEYKGIIKPNSILFKQIENTDMFYAVEGDDQSETFKVTLYEYDPERNTYVETYFDLESVPNSISVSVEYKRIVCGFETQGMSNKNTYFEMGGHMHRYTSLVIDVDADHVEEAKKYAIAEILSIDPNDTTIVNYLNDDIRMDSHKVETVGPDGRPIMYYNMGFSHLVNLDDPEGKNATLDMEIKKMTTSEYGKFFTVQKDIGEYTLMLTLMTTEEIEKRNKILMEEEHGK